MKKNKDLILIIALIIGLVGMSYMSSKKLKGSVKAGPLDKGEFVPEDDITETDIPDYQD